MRWKRGLLLTAAVTVLLAGSATGVPTATHVHFTAAGDYGQGTATGAVLDTIAAARPDLNLALGDLSYGLTGQEQSWCDFVHARVGDGFPFELLSGNHESDGVNGNINDFAACMPNQVPGVVGTYGRQYVMDVPQENPLLRFVMISPALHYPDGTWAYDVGTPRYSWTAAQIDDARADGIPWVVVGMHKPCLSVGVYGCEVGQSLVTMLMEKKVDLVLAGHEHSYQRTKQLALGTGCATLAIGSYDPDCVRDADDDFVAGAGTVFMTIGTGGVSQRDINDADAEMPYFDTVTGLNRDRTFGVGDFDVTADRLSMAFLRAPAGGTLSDAFTLTKGPPAPNASPLASFTSRSTDLSAGFDATASSDPDGRVASYAWSFGDGTTGTGVNPVHTYATAGTYEVTLTVTDDQGATGTSSRGVAVTDPPPSSTLVSDSFERTVASGWGTAPTGGPWTVRGPATRFSVGGGAGRMVVPGGQTLTADIGVSSTRTLTTAEFSVDKVVDGTYVVLIGRQVGADSYLARLRLQADSQARLYLLQNYATIASTPVIPGLSIAPGVRYQLKLEVVGTSPTRISAKVWRATDPEPAEWLRTGTNAFGALQTAGRPGVQTYLPSAVAAQGPVTLSVHDLVITQPPV